MYCIEYDRLQVLSGKIYFLKYSKLSKVTRQYDNGESKSVAYDINSQFIQFIHNNKNPNGITTKYWLRYEMMLKRLKRWMWNLVAHSNLWKFMSDVFNDYYFLSSNKTLTSFRIKGVFSKPLFDNTYE